jgi:WD40 repeat protein
MAKLFDAFISYGRADSKAFAQTLQARLDAQGFKVWFDFNDIPLGVDFQNQINDGIEKSSHFLFVISPHSVNSAYCLKEIKLAIELNKRIIPLLHVMQISQETWQQRNPQGTDQDWKAYQAKGLHESYQNMHPTICKLNWVYFQEDQNDFEKSLRDLVTLLNLHGDYVSYHTQLLAKALTWERNKKQTRYLLVGEARQEAEAWLKIHFKDEQPPCLPTNLHCEFITESIKNSNNLMTQVFLSYSSQDKVTMEKIQNSLRREGLTVWTNTTDIQTGEVFTEAISRGIEQADNLVYLLSPDAIVSPYCQQELDLAVSLHKRIIPLLVRETDPSIVPPVLNNIQYIDLTDNVEENDYQLDESQLLKILAKDEAYYNEHKILLTQALKWQRQQNNQSILLRGHKLQVAEAWLKVAQTRSQQPPIALQADFIAASLAQPPLESIDVFVCYGAPDIDFARKLNGALEIQGKTTWFDQDNIIPGDDPQGEIYRGINICGNFLLVLSPRSMTSPPLKLIEYAASLNKRFVVVVHQSIDDSDFLSQLPHQLPHQLEDVLNDVLQVEFHASGFSASFSQLIRTLDTDREHVHSHSKWLQRALEWEQKDRSDDLLLRGREFLIAQNWLDQTQQQQKHPPASSVQVAFIEASAGAITAIAAQEQRRQAEMLRLQQERAQEAEARLAEQQKHAKRQRLFLTAVSTALVVAVGLGGLAFHEWQEAEKQQEEAIRQEKRAESALENQVQALSEQSILLNQAELGFEALITVLRAIYLWKNFLDAKPAHMGGQLLSALQPVVYGNGFAKRNELTAHDDVIRHITFNPNGEMLASASVDGTIKFWNLQGELLHTLEEHEGSVNGVAFSPDGQILASASGDGTIKFWNLQGEVLQTLEGHGGAIVSVAFSPDGQTLASASVDQTIKFWNLQGEVLQTLEGHKGTVYSATFSPDGQTLASASDDGTVKLWNRQGEALKTLEGHEDSVTYVTFSPDGQTLVSAGLNGAIKFWHLQGEVVHRLGSSGEGWITSVAFSANGQTLASASDDGLIRLWTDKENIPDLQGHEAVINAVTFSPDGQTLASASDDGTVKLWNLQGEALQTLEGHGDWVTSVAFSPDGQALASASKDETVRLWNLQGKSLGTLEGHEAKVTTVTFSPDGQTLASVSDDGIVKLWSVQGQELHTLEDERSIVHVAFSPNGQTLASVSDDGTVLLWSVQGRKLRTLVDSESSIISIAFSPDGQTLASSGLDRLVKLWNLEGEVLQTLEGHKAQILQITFSSDGQILASMGLNGDVNLWTINGELLRTLQGLGAIAFSPDGQTLAIGNFTGNLESSSQTINLWPLTDLDTLTQEACDWLKDYLEHHAHEEDKALCRIS